MASSLLQGSGVQGSQSQMKCVGPQNDFINTGSSATFFKDVIRKHAMFVMTEVYQPQQNTGCFGKQVNWRLDRNHDLIRKIYFCGILDPIRLRIAANIQTADGLATSPAIVGSNGIIDGPGGIYNRWASWVGGVGAHAIQNVSLEIGNYTFDSLTGELIEIKNATDGTVDKPQDDMIGGCSSASETFYRSLVYQQLYVNLPFWFQESSSQAIPQIALSRHEINVRITFRTALQCMVQCCGYRTDGSDNLNHALTTTNAYHDFTNAATPDIQNAALMISGVHLDTNERALFARNQHEYLINQHQSSGDLSFAAHTSSQTTALRVSFNHPIQRMFWVFLGNEAADAHTWGDWSGGMYLLKPQGAASVTGIAQTLADHSFYTAKLTLNGADRTPFHSAQYFHSVVPNDLGKRIPSAFVYQYSFALDPSGVQSTGTLNGSKIDNMQWSIYRQGIVDYTHAAVNTGVAGTLAVSGHTYYAGTQRQAGNMRMYVINKNGMKYIGGMAGIYFVN